MSSCGLADEDDLIRPRENGFDEKPVGGAHDRSEQRMTIGHEADVLDDDERLAIGARRQEGREARHIDRVVNEDDVALPRRFENPAQRGRREQGIGRSAEPLDNIRREKRFAAHD